MLIALTEACIAITVPVSSLLQKRLDRASHRIFRIHGWGDDCINAPTEAEHFALLNETDFSENSPYSLQEMFLLNKLPALIDRGGTFYRNVHQDQNEFCEKNMLESFPAHRVYRPEILDPHIHEYRAAKAMNGSAGQGRSDCLYRW